MTPFGITLFSWCMDFVLSFAFWSEEHHIHRKTPRKSRFIAWKMSINRVGAYVSLPSAKRRENFCRRSPCALKSWRIHDFSDFWAQQGNCCRIFRDASRKWQKWSLKKKKKTIHYLLTRLRVHSFFSRSSRGPFFSFLFFCHHLFFLILSIFLYLSIISLFVDLIYQSLSVSTIFAYSILSILSIILLSSLPSRSVLCFSSDRRLVDSRSRVR